MRLALIAITVFGAACSRHADLLDEADAGAIETEPTLDAGDIPTLETDLGTDAFPPCSERPLGGCAGPVDFPCAFSSWAESTATACQESTGCQTNGWLEVVMGPDGCVSSIGMTEADDPIVECLVEAFGSVRCPCPASEMTHFFGIANTECE